MTYMGFTSLTYDIPHTSTGMREYDPDTTYIMDPVTITGKPPELEQTEKAAFPWLILIIAGALAVSQGG